MDPITNYLNQIINNDFASASETIEQVIKQRISEKFQKAKNDVKKK